MSGYKYSIKRYLLQVLDNDVSVSEKQANVQFP